MLKESLGMLEVKGLVAAITVADTMAKAANVHVRQRTLARGSGWTTILVTGDVGSVNAALSAGKSVAVERGWLVSSKVIARPANMLDLALEPDVNDVAAAKAAEKPAPKKAEAKVPDKAEVKAEVKAETKVETKSEIKTESKAENKEEIKAEAKTETKAETKSEATAEAAPKADVKKETKAAPAKGRKNTKKK
ncbi:BMC domain-containing protein [Lachnospiraceae bacterium C1.1]|nr:BMC domain-containing protein [Lachnospiraceae bacterium C1.1]